LTQNNPYTGSEGEKGLLAVSEPSGTSG